MKTIQTRAEIKVLVKLKGRTAQESLMLYEADDLEAPELLDLADEGSR